MKIRVNSRGLSCHAASRKLRVMSKEMTMINQGSWLMMFWAQVCGYVEGRFWTLWRDLQVCGYVEGRFWTLWRDLQECLGLQVLLAQRGSISKGQAWGSMGPGTFTPHPDPQPPSLL